MAVGVDGSRRPFVHGERDPALADDQDEVDGCEAEHPAGGRPRGDYEQAVIAARPEPAHSAHGVPAKAVRHQPLALGGSVEVAAELPAKSHGVSVSMRAGNTNTGIT